jgi:hypothetical protein
MHDFHAVLIQWFVNQMFVMTLVFCYSNLQRFLYPYFMISSNYVTPSAASQLKVSNLII